MEAIQQNISHSSSELVEAQNQQIVRVAGLITKMRPHTTRKGDPMAFVTIEDIQGVIELVVFPRTYAKYQEFLQWDNIIMVDGKVDARGSMPKVLVDHVTTELDHVTPLQGMDRPKQVSRPRQQRETVEPGHKPKDPPVQAPKKVSDPSPPYQPDWNDEGMPPPPEEFPPGWDDSNGVVLEPVEPALTSQPLASESIPAETPLPPSAVEEPAQEPEVIPDENGGAQIPAQDGQPLAEVTASPPQGITEIPAEDTGSSEPSLPQAEVSKNVLQPILPPLRGDTAEDAQMITVILRPRADRTRDKLLLRRIFGIMISQPGNDRFAFHIFEQGRGHLLEFPNLTTGICPELLDQVKTLVGSDNIRIEPITFQ
jgi:DNA polymerase-3 subunit alpha